MDVEGRLYFHLGIIRRFYGQHFCPLQQRLVHHMNTIHSLTYTRNNVSKKPRKPRKDKGCIRLDYARLLSGYNGPEEGEGLSQALESEVIAEDGADGTCQFISPGPQSKEITEAENERSNSVAEAEEI